MANEIVVYVNPTWGALRTLALEAKRVGTLPLIVFGSVLAGAFLGQAAPVVTVQERIVTKESHVLVSCASLKSALEANKVIYPETNELAAFRMDNSTSYSSNPKVAKDQMANWTKIDAAKIKARSDAYKVQETGRQKMREALVRGK